MSRSGPHRIPIPTPFLVGDVNVYLIKDDPLTLVDTGPNLGSSLAALEAGLAAHGVTVEDLELIVLTHQHTDHIGLAQVLQQRSGASVAAWHQLAAFLGAYPERAAANDEYAHALMALHGVPQDLNAAMAVSSHLARALGSGAAVDLPLRDHGSLDLAGRSFLTFHRPGHSPSDVILYDEACGTAIGGDHLMASVASNAILAKPLADAEPAGRPRPLLDYRDSLRATLALPERTVILPGHGPDVTDHRRLIPERLHVHERRARKILRTLANGPLTAHQIALAMWGRMAVTQAPLMMSEVLGYLDLLLADESVAESASVESASAESASAESASADSPVTFAVV